MASTDRRSVEVAVSGLGHALRLAAGRGASECAAGDRRPTQSDRKERTVAEVGESPEIAVRSLKELIGAETFAVGHLVDER